MTDEYENEDMVVMLADSEPITIPRGILVAVLDIAAGSMNFSSGFLCDAEVEALRRFAVYVGADPDVNTPNTHICKYKGEHQWQKPGWSGSVADWYCPLCQKCSDVNPEEEKPEDHYGIS